MDLKIDNNTYIVTGASSGLGNAVAHALLNEGANLIVNARSKIRLDELKESYPDRVVVIFGDVTKSETIDNLLKSIKNRRISGVFVNAGGPPAKNTLETTMKDWDESYQLLIRWKVDLVKRLIPHFLKNKYGRILFSESSAVKQPIENLTLSNSMRMAIVGFTKSLSEEISGNGITVNTIAPGVHDTKALQRLFDRKANDEDISTEEARQWFETRTSVGFIGSPEDFASLSAWLLSPHSRFITGQTISIDGGAVKSSFG